MTKKEIFSWDGEQSGEELVIREMLFGDVVEVLRNHEKKYLKRLFLKNLHRFTRENRSFWILVLKVSDSELERYSEKNFRESSKLFPF